MIFNGVTFTVSKNNIVTFKYQPVCTLNASQMLRLVYYILRCIHSRIHSITNNVLDSMCYKLQQSTMYLIYEYRMTRIRLKLGQKFQNFKRLKYFPVVACSA